ncbi:ABC transporter permease/substrate-binding protein [Maricaulaceae bacterium MS644]
MGETLQPLIEQLPAYLGGHIRLSLAAILSALAISLPLGVFAARNPRLAGPSLTVASVLQTIPGLALLALMVPLLGGMIGFLPAYVALTLYGILPVLRNTIVGLQGVDAGVREAARGVGMSQAQSLFRVELPLAAPAIVAGVRTASVWVIGAAVLATPVGATSLGNYIFSGLQTRNWAAVVFGCICSAGLAILLDQTIRALQVSASSGKRLRAALAGIAMVAVPAGAILGAQLATRDVDRMARSDDAVTGFGGEPVVIGAKSFTEQYILAEVMGARLEAAGAQVRRRDNLGSTVVFDALISGEIDIYVEYTGTLWGAAMQREASAPRAVMNAAVSSWLYETHGVVSLGGLGFENAYGFAVSRGLAEAQALQTIGDLTRVEDLSVGADPEFFSRPEWERVRGLYGLSGVEQRSMDSTFMYAAVRDRQVDAVTAYTTDGRILAYDLRVLEDPAGALPPYDAILLISADAAQRPAIARALAPLIGAIDAELMREANAVVEVERRTVGEAAQLILDALAD